MSAHRYPVFVWQHPGGLWMARLLSAQVELTAAGARQGVAVAELERRAQAMIKGGGWEDEEPLAEPTLLEMAFHIHPEFSARGRTWPLRDVVRLLLPVVTCAEPPFRVAFIPTLGLLVRMMVDEDLKTAITNRVQRWFAEEPPGFVAGYLPPQAQHLDWVSIARGRQRERAQKVSLAPLDQVAEAIGALDHGAWQRDAQVRELATRLGTRSVAVVGEPGCGKTTILRAAARLAERQRATGEGAQPQQRLPPRFWLSGGQRLIAGMRWFGQWQERCEQVVQRLAAIDGTLCVESLSELLQVGGLDASDSIAAFLTPYLQRNELRLVGECTAQELAAMRRQLPGFADAFSVLTVPPMDRLQTLAVVAQAGEAAARRHGVELAPGVALEVESLFHHHLGDAGFPGPAARFVDLLTRDGARAGSARLDRSDVLAAFSRHTGLPDWLLRDDVVILPAEISARFERSVIGQPQAVAAAVEVVLAIKAGLCDPGRPLASVLLAGPTGVGKTQLARTLAQELFPSLPSERALVRIDLSEYAGGDAVDRLLGRDRQPSELVRRLRQQPSALVLFDEIEKAHPVIFDLLLGALDEGRFQDQLGRTTSLRQAVVVMTTNLGSESRPLRGFSGQEDGGEIAAAEISQAISEHFRPEFLARLDRVVVFRALDRSSIQRICIHELEALGRRQGMLARGLSLSWDRELIVQLAIRGFDPQHGARPLQRAIQDLVAARLARLLVLSGTQSGKRIHLGWDGHEVSIQMLDG